MLPTVAEVLALDPLRRGAPRVVGAGDGLDAPVRWVHVIARADAAHPPRRGARGGVPAGAARDARVRGVHGIELAEPAHLLRGGELVLSTGIALPDDVS